MLNHLSGLKRVPGRAERRIYLAVIAVLTLCLLTVMRQNRLQGTRLARATQDPAATVELAERTQWAQWARREAAEQTKEADDVDEARGIVNYQRWLRSNLAEDRIKHSNIIGEELALIEANCRELNALDEQWWQRRLRERQARLQDPEFAHRTAELLRDPGFVERTAKLLHDPAQGREAKSGTEIRK
jgi:hypothetical protein